MNWTHLKAAVKTVEEGAARKVDGDGFKVYKVSDAIVRVDIQPKDE